MHIYIYIYVIHLGLCRGMYAHVCIFIYRQICTYVYICMYKHLLLCVATSYVFMCRYAYADMRDIDIHVLIYTFVDIDGSKDARKSLVNGTPHIYMFIGVKLDPCLLHKDLRWGRMLQM